MLWSLSALLVLALAFTVAACSGSVQQEAADDWLAIVGSDTITVNQYTYRFETAPHTGFGATARRDFLDALILERLLAHASPDTAERYTALRSQMVAEARVESYLIDRIADEVEVAEADVRANVIRAIRTLTVQAWAADDSLTATRILARYQAGESFERAGGNALIGTVFLDSVTIQWNSTAVALEELAYTLELDEAGGPVLADGRWWVLRLIRFKQDRIPGEPVYQELGPWVRDALAARRAREKQPALIAEAMHGHLMDIDPDGWRWLVAALREQLNWNRDPDLEIPFTALSETTLSSLNDSASQSLPLLHVEGPIFAADWTRADVVLLLEMAPKPVPRSEDPRRFEHDLHAHLRWLVEFAVLDQLAADAGYSLEPRVVRDSLMWSQHLSAREELNSRLAAFVADDESPGEPQVGVPRSSTADEALLAFFRESAGREGVRINQARLDALELIDIPVFVRKQHFPNRPATPLPVGQPWATEIDF